MQKQRVDSAGLWFGLGLAVGLFLFQRLTGRQANATKRIAPLAAWEQVLAERYGIRKAALLAARVQARYAELFVGRLHFSNGALRSHFEEHILPGIALYQVLLQETADPAKALEDLDRCFTAQARASSMGRQARLLDHLPGGFTTLRIASRIILRSNFPEQGWKIEMVEDSPQCIAYNITDCFYLNVLRAYGLPELTSHFCAGDDLLYGNLETIAWERTETLGRGNARCNFVFRQRVPFKA